MPGDADADVIWDLDDSPLVLFSHDEEGVPVYIAGESQDTVRERVELDLGDDDIVTGTFLQPDLDAVFDSLISEPD